jgi:hypothetical protein
MTSIRIFTVGTVDDSFRKMTTFVTLDWLTKYSDLPNSHFVECYNLDRKITNIKKVGKVVRSENDLSYQDLLKLVKLVSIQ